MKTLSTILGCILILGGILLGGWVALYWCLYGGIVQIVEGFKATPISTGDVALGFVRFFCTALSFWLTFLVCVFVGAIFISAGEKEKGEA